MQLYHGDGRVDRPSGLEPTLDLLKGILSGSIPNHDGATRDNESYPTTIQVVYPVPDEVQSVY